MIAKTTSAAIRMPSRFQSCTSVWCHGVCSAVASARSRRPRHAISTPTTSSSVPITQGAVAGPTALPPLLSRVACVIVAIATTIEDPAEHQGGQRGGPVVLDVQLLGALVTDQVAAHVDRRTPWMLLRVVCHHSTFPIPRSSTTPVTRSISVVQELVELVTDEHHGLPALALERLLPGVAARSSAR